LSYRSLNKIVSRSLSTPLCTLVPTAETVGTRSCSFHAARDVPKTSHPSSPCSLSVKKGAFLLYSILKPAHFLVNVCSSMLGVASTCSSFHRDQ
jgi:hypothetical protein